MHPPRTLAAHPTCDPRPIINIVKSGSALSPLASPMSIPSAPSAPSASPSVWNSSTTSSQLCDVGQVASPLSLFLINKVALWGLLCDRMSRGNRTNYGLQISPLRLCTTNPGLRGFGGVSSQGLWAHPHTGSLPCVTGHCNHFVDEEGRLTRRRCSLCQPSCSVEELGLALHSRLALAHSETLRHAKKPHCLIRSLTIHRLGEKTGSLKRVGSRVALSYSGVDGK